MKNHRCLVDNCEVCKKGWVSATYVVPDKKDDSWFAALVGFLFG